MLSGTGAEVGAVRNVILGPGIGIHEQLVSLDDEALRLSYCGLNFGEPRGRSVDANPFPGDVLDYRATIQVLPVTVGAIPAAYLSWRGQLWTQPSTASAVQSDLQVRLAPRPLSPLTKTSRPLLAIAR